jgi:hypothetical protein
MMLIDDDDATVPARARADSENLDVGDRIRDQLKKKHYIYSCHQIRSTSTHAGSASRSSK